MPRRRTLAAVGALAGVVGAGTIAQRRLLDSIRADPENEFLRRPLDGEEHTVRTEDGASLHVEEFGPADAPRVLLVHGWMCSLGFWRYQIDSLASEFRVVAYDKRGHGRSPQAGDYSFDRFADDLDSVIEARIPEGERVVVAGHSMGAMTLAAWAGRHPERVPERLAGCAMINTGLGDLTTEAVVMRTPRRLSGLREVLGRMFLVAQLPFNPGPSPIADAVVRYVAMNPDTGPARVAFCREMVLSSNPRVRGASGRAMSEMDLWDALEHLDVPAVAIAGGADKMTPVRHAHRLAESIPGEVELVELPGIGHMAPLEAPEEITQAIRELARRTLGRGAEAASPAAAAA